MPSLQVREDWSLLKKTAFRFIAIYFLLFIISFSFPYALIPDIGKFTSPLFQLLTSGHKIQSDSTGMYLNLLVIAIISLVVCIFWTVKDRNRKNYRMHAYWLRSLASYYLASHLLIYGFSKIFKWQFYLPEPNTLYTPLADIPRDLLYWTVMGTSRPYSIFLGSLEIIAALLLLFRRSRSAGGFVAAVILLNVLVINLSFDISVKILSCFLFIISLMVAMRSAAVPGFIKKRKPAYLITKTLLVLFLIADALFVYFKSGNYNDDMSSRPKFHGAYQVVGFIRNNDTLPPLLTDTVRWKRVFVHRREYFIIQDMNDIMQDYSMKLDTVRKTMLLDNVDDSLKYRFRYQQTNNSDLILSGVFKHDSVRVYLKYIDPRNIKLLKNEFHWTSDE